MAASTKRSSASTDEQPDGTHPSEEPTGITIGEDELAAGIEEPAEKPDAINAAIRAAADRPATFGEALAGRADEQSGTLPPQIGELLELPDGNYRIYSLQRRDGDRLRNSPPEIAIHARLEPRPGR
jgi:hypothetical protein